MIEITQALVDRWLEGRKTGGGQPASEVEVQRARAVEEMKRAAAIFGLEVVDQSGERAYQVVWDEIAPVRISEYIQVYRTNDGRWAINDEFGTEHDTFASKEEAVSVAQRLSAEIDAEAQRI